ncbi:MAG: UDP-N-acetylmuramate--L-alanine ligase [Propionibacteriaceae bacterium]|jgi:UDP-N-acetylmuramate--alanine ligase|nr:UDP-N-acetylmuramate--L-alanine ligase [Propionibacteriaceae bacterium]
MPLIEPQEIPALDTLGRTHFVAIGGAGMSGVAAGFLARGLEVSGCDQEDSKALRDVAKLGAKTWVGHDRSHVEEVDTLVVSTAIREDNPDLAEARRLGVRVLHRSVALASLMEGHQVISVAGTHGKTTTTAMCVAGLHGATITPSYVLGGIPLKTGLGAQITDSPYFIVEADESDGTLRQYPTTIAIITTVEPDHLDNWITAERYRQGFVEFATGERISTVILCCDDTGARELANSLTEVRVVTYGTSKDADFRLSEVDPHRGTATVINGEESIEMALGIPGLHNILNATATLCLAEILGVDREGFLQGLAGFEGTSRRFEEVGTVAGITVVDDYAHHPTEVEATLTTARLVAAGSGRVVVCFQPHLYSRTQAFYEEFGEALALADEVIVLDVYPAREDPIPGVTGELIAHALARRGGTVHYVPALDNAVDALKSLVKPGDLVLTVGAGSITTVGPKLIDALGS